MCNVHHRQLEVVREICAYLVSDARRQATFDALQSQVGTAPGVLLAAGAAKIERAIVAGGIKPPMRAAKLLAAAEIAWQLDTDLATIVTTDTRAALRILQKFPGIGRPSALRIMAACGQPCGLPLEINGMRVLLRLGWGTAQGSCAVQHRSVLKSLGSVPESEQLRAHNLLRQHGRALCKNTKRGCTECPLVQHCDFCSGPKDFAPR